MGKRVEFAVESKRDGAVGLLRLRGEVAAENVGRMHDAAEALRSGGAKHLLIDLTGVTFIDSASVGELVRLEADGEDGGGHTVLHSLPRIVRRVLDVTGLAARVKIATDEKTARALL